MKSRAAALIIALLATPLVAQVAEPVYVAFRFAASTAAKSFPTTDSRLRAEAEISALLAATCQGKFGWWQFKAATSDRDWPRLNVWLKDSLDWQVVAAFVDPNGVQIERPWEGKLFTAEDFELQATRLQFEGWGEPVATQFEREILDARRAELIDILQKHAPVARNVRMPDAAAVAPVVISLRWEDYKNLSGSLFAIVCKSRQGTVTLHTTGIGVPTPFPAAQPPFDAVSAELSQWESDGQLVPIASQLNQVTDLKPLVVLLKEYRTAWSVAAPDNP